MGVIKHQGTRQSMVHVLGVLIGVFSTLVIYPLDKESLGLARFLLDGALVLAPFALLGFALIPVKFFPLFQDRTNGHNGFFTYVLRAAALLVTLFICTFLIFAEEILVLLNPSNPGFGSFFMWLLPFTIFTALGTLFYNYSSLFGKTAVPYGIKNLILKVALPLLVFLYFSDLIDRSNFVLWLCCSLVLSVLGLLLYIGRIGALQLGKINNKLVKSNRRAMVTYGLFGLLGSVGSVLVFKIDSLMISAIKDFGDNGVFSIGVNIANIISAPVLAIGAIAGPIISRSWHQKDHEQISFIYRESSLVLLIFGMLVILLLYFCMEDLITLFPNADEFETLYEVTLILGVAKLIDLAASVNNEIIVYSRYYKFNLVSMLVLGVFNVILNYYFIKILDMGILGAAIATSISLIIFNLVKFVFIYIKMKMQPFDRKTIWVLLISALVWGVFSLMSLSYRPLINLMLHGTAITILYLTVVLRSKISHQFNDYVSQLVDYVVSFRS